MQMTRRSVLSQMGVLASIPGSAGTKLPKPDTSGRVSAEQCILQRRSVRAYRAAPLGFADVGQLLWAAQGITGGGRLRAAPSAGALYPLETYLVAGDVQALGAGVYRYQPGGHDLVMVKAGDIRRELAQAATDQECVRDGAVVIVIAAMYGRTTTKYGQRGIRYVHMEAGHAAQNVYLQATALGLGTVAVGAFRDTDVKRIIELPSDQEPLYLMPVGRIRS
jgi:SagB-type dehydrogenase family enzyme